MASNKPRLVGSAAAVVPGRLPFPAQRASGSAAHRGTPPWAAGHPAARKSAPGHDRELDDTKELLALL